MAWISVWQEVDGPKLRKLAKALESSKAEALGILNYIWFWAMNNADETGRAMEADRWDIEDIVQGVTKPLSAGKPAMDAEKVVDALFSTGWLDEVDGCIFIHDWDQWQEQWYKLQRERKRNAERMRKKRSEEKDQKAVSQTDEASAEPDAPPSEPIPEESPKDAATGHGEKKKEPAKRQTPEKVQYAEYVSMKESEYEKLIQRYGKPFADACIEELDNYKGAKKGRTYKDDYRAILSWVVDRINEKRPGFMSASKAATSEPRKTGNPFEEWGD